MILDSLLDILNHKLLETQNRPLNNTEILILRGIWQSQTYSQIAEQGGYSPGYFTNVVAPALCQRLSQLVGKRVTKKNCRILLESYVAAQTTEKTALTPQTPARLSLTDQKNLSPRFPSGAVPLNSPYYIENTTITTQIYEEISKSGALVRIKAPQEMGKTSLLLRVLEYANRQGYRTISLDLEQVEQTILSDLNRFLRWLCANVSRQLQLETKLDEYWDEDIGSKVSCTLYFRSYLLENIDSPVVLALDEVNQIFEHQQVAKEVLPLLRSWYEEAKRLPIWQKLRLIVVHSTEIYVPLHIQQSPFNVGLPIQLTGFDLEQIQQLAQRYKLDWMDASQAQLLMDVVGGHPALVHLAIYHLSRGEMSLTQLLQSAPTSAGIYSNHLQRHWANLQEQLELAQTLHQVMNATESIPIEPIQAYKLSSMGLIKLNGNRAIPSCNLYRKYFQLQPPIAEQQELVEKVK